MQKKILRDDVENNMTIEFNSDMKKEEIIQPLRMDELNVLCTDEDSAIHREMDELIMQIMYFLSVIFPRGLKKVVSSMMAIDPVLQNSQIDHEFSSKEVVGKISIKGNQVYSANIEIRLLKRNRGTPFLAILKEPLALDQILAVQRFIERIIELINDVEDFSPVDSSQSIHFKLQAYLSELESVCELSNIIIDNLREISTYLRLPSARRFPVGVKMNKKIFAPDIPHDICLEFYVHRAKLVISVFAFELNPNPRNFISHISRLEGDNVIGQVICYQNSLVDIIDHAKASAVIPFLDEILTEVDRNIELCTKLRNHAEALLQACL